MSKANYKLASRSKRDPHKHNSQRDTLRLNVSKTTRLRALTKPLLILTMSPYSILLKSLAFPRHRDATKERLSRQGKFTGTIMTTWTKTLETDWRLRSQGSFVRLKMMRTIRKTWSCGHFHIQLSLQCITGKKSS